MKIKELKKKGLSLLKKNVWTFLFIGILMSFVIGRYIINNDGFSNLRTVYEYVTEADHIDKDYLINEYSDKIISQVFTGNVTTLIENYNKENGITKGIFFSAFNFFTKGQLQIQNTFNSIVHYQKDSIAKSIILIVASAIGIIIRILIVYPLRVGETRIYLESINYKKTRIRRIVYAFRKTRYFNSIKVLLLKEIRKFLWNLTIVGGIIKNYSYKMVPYIVAENPTIKATDAIKMSKEMMNGHKFEAFKLDCSFIGWILLQYASFGILGIFVSPYYTSTETQLYLMLREEYINKKKYNFESLNDELLYVDNILEKYPDPLFKVRNKKEINYNTKYRFTSIILFFFIFSFVGWVWEVLLYLFRDGILVNRGVMYGPWLPIYGFGCTFVLLFTKFKWVRKILKNPLITFLCIMLLCTGLEYLGHWGLEKFLHLRYWDYTGVFLNIKGRVCLECSLFFGVGGSLALYIIAPFIEARLEKLNKDFIAYTCIILVITMLADWILSLKYPHKGEGITVSQEEMIDNKDEETNDKNITNSINDLVSINETM